MIRLCFFKKNNIEKEWLGVKYKRHITAILGKPIYINNYQKFENRLLVTVAMEQADRVGGKNGNTVALLQNMDCPDVDKKMSFQISDYRIFRTAEFFTKKRLTLYSAKTTQFSFSSSEDFGLWG